MKIALFAPKEDFITFTKKVNYLVDDLIVVDQYDSPTAFLNRDNNKIYSALWVATGGAKGMEMVIELQEKSPNAHVIWESDDQNFALTACELHPAYFLYKKSNAESIITAIANIQRGKRHHLALCSESSLAEIEKEM